MKVTFTPKGSQESIELTENEINVLKEVILEESFRLGAFLAWARISNFTEEEVSETFEKNFPLLYTISKANKK